MLVAIQCHERCAFRHILHDDMLTFDLIGIERVQGLTHLMQHEVRGIHHVVYRTQTDGGQTLLEPIRRLFHGHTLDAHA